MFAILKEGPFMGKVYQVLAHVSWRDRDDELFALCTGFDRSSDPYGMWGEISYDANPEWYYFAPGWNVERLNAHLRRSESEIRLFQGRYLDLVQDAEMNNRLAAAILNK